MSNDHKIIGYTKINKESYDFTWAISDYLLVLEVEDGKIESPIFDIGNEHQAQFQFKLNKRKDANTDKVFLYLLCVKTNAKMKSSYKLSVMRDDEIVHRAMDGHTFISLGLKKIFDVDTRAMNEFCSSTGTVTIHCQLTIATGSTQNSLNNETAEADEVPKPKSVVDELRDEQLGTVVLLTASEKKLTAPRSVLAKSSPVFKKMLDNYKSHYIDMRNVSYKAAIEMLRYMNTGRIETRQFSLMDNILAADSKYQIKGLKQKCEDILISNLSPRNGLDNIELADKYDMPRLRERAWPMLSKSC